MAPRIRNISADEFRRLFQAPEIQTPGLTVSDAINLSNALEQRKANDEQQKLRIAKIERAIAEEEAKAQDLQREQQLGELLTTPAQGAETIPTPQGDVPTPGPIQSIEQNIAEAEKQQEIDNLRTQLDPTGRLDAQEAEKRAQKETNDQFQRDVLLEREKIKGRLAVEAFKASNRPNEKKELATKAKTSLTGVINDVAENYERLRKAGAIVDINKSPSENVKARIESSEPAQAIAGAFGGTEQSIRNEIVMSRPLLINFIRQASEMGARGLDSEKELEFYLSAATDPTRDVQANLAALARLDKAYGMGTFKAPKEAAAKLDAEFKETNPQVGKIMAAKEWLKNNPNHPKAEQVRQKLQELGE